MTVRMVNTPQMRMRRWMAVLVVAVAALIIAPQAFADDATSPVISHTDTYVVADGETLWQIAAQFTEDGGDVRETVALLKSMNLLESSSLEAGDQLLVPLLG